MDELKIDHIWVSDELQMGHRGVTHYLHIRIQHFSFSSPNLSIFDPVTILPHLGYEK